jgi:acyl-coenzyme A thioesterase PaaI-like protein
MPSRGSGATIRSMEGDTRAGRTGAERTHRTWLLKMINLYPPLLGAGIRVRRTGADRRAFEVRMRLTVFNRNYVGTHFGGSLYAMCDPFFMLILIPALGPEYVVWDKAATIRFVRPGRGTVRAAFDVPDERVEAIRREVDANGRAEPVFTAQVLGSDGEVVAEVDKTLYVRRRRAAGQPSQAG